MSRDGSRLRAGAFLILLAAGASCTAGAVETDVRSYRNGRRALDAGDATTAIEAFRTAIAADPIEGLTKVRGAGVVYEDYLPHFYLGVACEKAGRREDALHAFAESARQAVVDRRPELRRRLDDAVRRLVPPPTAEAAPGLGAGPPAPIATAAPAPANTPARLPTLEKPPSLERAPATAGPVPAPTDPLPPDRFAPDERIAVRAGVRAFFEGNHERAIALLSGPGERLPSTRLVFAYALATRFVLSGSTPPDLLSRARAAYASARAGGARDTDPRLGSPALRRLLSSPSAVQKRTINEPTTR